MVNKKQRNESDLVPRMQSRPDTAEPVEPFVDIMDVDSAKPVEQEIDFEEPVERDYTDVLASKNVSVDPSATISAALLAAGRLYNDAGLISAALCKHLSAVAAEPELHAVLQRLQVSFGDFRHAFEQIENGMSEGLRDAIEQALLV